MFKLFLTALMFYTRIPCPKGTPHDPESINKATVYFPVMGWLAGALAGSVFFFSAQHFSTLTAALLSTIATILLTGAFHEDGFSDVCDGFGGGWTKERILEIMKDSRIGVFGALGLLLLISLKITLIDDAFFLNGYLRDEPWIIILLFVNAHTLSRYMACACIYAGQYARSNDDVGAKAKPVGTGLSPSLFFIATVFSLAPLLLLIELSYKGQFVWVLLPMAILTWRMYAFFKRWIGGYTGDCLGAIQQINEVVFYFILVLII